MSKIDWVRVLTSREHASGYMRRPCNGHEMGCLWLLLSKPTQEVTNDMKITDTNVPLRKVAKKEGKEERRKMGWCVDG